MRYKKYMPYKKVAVDSYLNSKDQPLQISIPDITAKVPLLSWICYEADGPIFWPDGGYTGYWRSIDEGSPYAILNNINENYKSYYIPKRTGGSRRIDAPSNHLKMIQRWILNDILYSFPCSRYAKAYIKNRSICDNARFHQNRRLVITLDIKDFFNSIKAYHVYNWFKKCDYPESVTVLLTNLCVFNGSLPQGAPTSGYLSNLIMSGFDSLVAAYCREKSIRYTRYADDMTFSGNADIDIAKLIFFVEQQLKVLGLELNRNKVKVLHQSARQKTTGIVLNNKMQVPREYRMKLRQEIHYIHKYGLDSHLAVIGETNRTKYLESLSGRIQYVLSIRKDDEDMQHYLKYVNALIAQDSYPYI